MKYIQKSKEPNSLTNYRKQKEAYFDGYPEKDELRKSLLKEQKYLCCYCMSRIIKKEQIDNVDLGKVMKIEHRKSQTKFPDLQLSYNNLLGACNGNKGQPKHLQHCDTHKSHYDGKEDFELKINPVLAICEKQIKFKRTGEICSDDNEINQNLNEILNLNYEILVKNRKRTLKIALESLTKKYQGNWSKDMLQKEIDRWENSNLEEYQPYCQIVIYFLKKKLAQY